MLSDIKGCATACIVRKDAPLGIASLANPSALQVPFSYPPIRQPTSPSITLANAWVGSKFEATGHVARGTFLGLDSCNRKILMHSNQIPGVLECKEGLQKWFSPDGNQNLNWSFVGTTKRWSPPINHWHQITNKMTPCLISTSNSTECQVTLKPKSTHP